MKQTKEFNRYVSDLEKNLIRDYGHLLTGEALQNLLGFKSTASFQQALHRGVIDVPIFPIEKRRGKFALTKDVAEWLAKKRFEAINKNNKGGIS